MTTTPDLTTEEPAPWNHNTPTAGDEGRAYFAVAGVAREIDVWDLDDSATIYCAADGRSVGYLPGLEDDDKALGANSLWVARSVASALGALEAAGLSVFNSVGVTDAAWEALELDNIGFCAPRTV